jgi:subtilisin-like proprotein convertase family protein
MKTIALFVSLYFYATVYSQTLTGGGGPILDLQTIEFPLTVSLPQNSIDTIDFGLETICIDLTHTWLADLTIELIAPDGTTRILASGVGGGEDNMTNTCFNYDSGTPIQNGTAPFTGTFRPMGQMGAVNNGQDPNGVWYLRINDNYGQDEGQLLNWSVTFGGSPAGYFSFKESDLPIVLIETNGQPIDNDIKINADMSIIYNGPGLRNHVNDIATEYDGKIGIEYRGNYSLSLPQKPYSFELRDNGGLEIDSSLLGMPAEHDWLLLANYNDKSFARNVLPFHLFNKMGHYSVRSRFVDVVMNGEYQGIYLLAEKIKRDPNRIAISKMLPTDTSGLELSGGYVFKVDYWDDLNSWESNFSPIGFPGLDIHYVYYYPSHDVIAISQKQYLQNFVNELETSLYANYFADSLYGYRKYISERSFQDYFIVNELARNRDGFKKSRFFFKDKDHPNGTYSKLHAGPVWDFDWAWKDMWSGAEDGSGFMYAEVAQDVNAPGWYIRLLQDTLFANALRCRYEDLRRTILDINYLHSQVDSVAAVVAESQNWHYQVWGHLGLATGTPEVQAPSQTYTEEVQRLKDWITRRITWLDANMPGSLSGCSMTGVEENSLITVDVHPNPFMNELTVILNSSSSGKVELTDLNGQIIRVLELMPGQKAIQMKELEYLASGLYLLQIEQNGVKNIVRVVHQRSY